MNQWIEALADRFAPGQSSLLPLSFVYGGQSSSTAIRDWALTANDAPAKQGRRSQTFRGVIGGSGLRLICEVSHFDEFPASEWVLFFENTGNADSAILEDIAVADYTFHTRLPDVQDVRITDCDQVLPLQFPFSQDTLAPFVLHRTNGAPSDATDFEVSRIALCAGAQAVLRAGGGRSSNHDLPFFRIDCAQGSAIVAVGWSGQWKATLDVSENGESLRLRAGMEHARFFLKPGERVRLPRILFFLHEGEHRESNSRFRRLISTHYVPKFQGQGTTAHLYCNTCFTRKGTWLNECDEQNQISLIRALRPLDAEAVITDAGWFVGGWPNGAGNWDPDPDKYPNGMAPVAQAAKEEGMVYGLWFEPERVTAGTAIHRERPEWVLWRKDDEHTGLLDFGRPEVQDYFFNIVSPFMALPGFGAYRQDFNMNPLQWWLDNDEPNRLGITEMKYVEGLYAYWDRLADAFPDSFLVDCASGGRRIDLESIKRFHVHQKSDYWFDNITDQSSLFGLSQYLPNGVIMTPIDRLDETTFHSTLASSLCLGWIADASDFDRERAAELVDTYRKVRHLLNKDWYPLTPFSRSNDTCLGVQFNSPEDGEGIVLLFRRERCPLSQMQATLRGVCADAQYEITSHSSGRRTLVKGSDLASGYTLALPQAGKSELLSYGRDKG
jgi:alpha-galactosidase